MPRRDAFGLAVAHTVHADGAIQSPQLLQLSGVGPAGLLGRLGLPVVAPLDGVGRNLQDHLQVRPSYRCQGIETLNDIAHSRWRSAREFMRYLLTRGGALNGGVYRAGAFFPAGDDAAGWPDAQIHFGLVSFERPHQPPHPFPGVTLSACLLRPHSRGEIMLRSADPLAAPSIQPHGQRHAAAGLGAPPRRQHLPPGGHLRHGPRRRRRRGGGCPPAGPRAAGAARGGRFGDAAAGIWQHERADHHDRRARRRPRQARPARLSAHGTARAKPLGR